MSEAYACMTNDELHQILSDFIQKQLMMKNSAFNEVEWDMMMDCYCKNKSAQSCADLVHISLRDAEFVYTSFAMAASLHALAQMKD